MSIRHIETFISIFDAFGSDSRPKTLTTLAAELDQPKSSMHNMIETLVELGLLYEVRPRRGFYPTKKLYNIVAKTLRGDPIVEYMQGHLDALAQATGETVLLSIREGRQVVYLGVAESPHAIRYFAEVGDRRPAHATSGGKAIFSSYTDDQLMKELKSIGFESFSSNTISSPNAFIETLNEGRKRGWHINNSEYTPDVSGIGVPIEIDGRSMALSVAGPNYRLANRHEELAEFLQSEAHKILSTFE